MISTVGLSVSSLHVLPVFAWVPPRCSGSPCQLGLPSSQLELKNPLGSSSLDDQVLNLFQPSFDNRDLDD